MRTYTVSELIDPLMAYAWAEIYNPPETSGSVLVNIWTADEFKGIAKRKYGHMYFDAFDPLESDTEAQALIRAQVEFLNTLSVFKTLHGSDYARAVYGLSMKYNPLENYDRVEEGKEIDAKHKGSVTTETITEAGTETNAHHKGSKVSVGEETIVTPRVQTKNTTYKVPFDTSSEVETDALVSEPVSGTDKTERDSTKNFTKTEDLDSSTFDRDERSFSQDRATTRTTEAADKSATVFDKDVREYDGRRTHGNIGVTTSQQMLDAEMELRTRGFREGLIRRFIGEYCYYVKGVE